MAKVVTFGEIMLRLAPNGYNRFFQDDQTCLGKSLKFCFGMLGA